MSRTHSHVPSKLLRDESYNLLVPYKEFKRHSNVKSKIIARKTRRKVRHSLIDDESIYLINAIAEYKTMSYIARDKFW